MGMAQLVGGERQLGVRFQLVNLVPATALVVFVLLVVWSGAPTQSPELSRAWATASALDAGQAVLLVFAVTVASLVAQPLQRPLVRVLEGYWLENPLWPAWVHRLGTAWQRARSRRLSELAGARPDPALIQAAKGNGRAADRAARELAELRRRARTAVWQRSRRFPAPERLLATALGNALRAAEDDAGQRYNLATVLVWPGLYAVLGDRTRAIVDDLRLQLDVAARLCAMSLLAAVLAAVLLVSFWPWGLLVPAGAVGVAWLAYRAAVNAAIAYGEGLRLAVDLHRFDLLAALHLPLPADFDAELAANRTLSQFYALAKPPQFRYQHDQDTTPAATSPPAADADNTRTGLAGRVWRWLTRPG
jgi:hypothetical protein